MKKINVLSLFDGMSFGQIVLNRLNFNINNYYASEIDKSAIKVTKHNYKKTIHLGDYWTNVDIIQELKDIKFKKYIVTDPFGELKKVYQKKLSKKLNELK